MQSSAIHPSSGGLESRGKWGAHLRSLAQDRREHLQGAGRSQCLFFRRVFPLTARGRHDGSAPTGAISFGDNRVAGLAAILSLGGRIYSAEPARPWPGEAAVLVSVIHIARGDEPWVASLSSTLNGVPCPVISSRLQPRQEGGEPHTLMANEGLAHIGTSMGGAGFVLTKQEASRFLAVPENRTVLLPVTGEEVNASPSAQDERFAITFGGRSLDEASHWPELLEVVRQRVLPQRMKGRDHGPGNHGKKFWWQHVLRRRSALSRNRQPPPVHCDFAGINPSRPSI